MDSCRRKSIARQPIDGSSDAGSTWHQRDDHASGFSVFQWYNLHGGVANRTQKLVDRRSSPEQLPARSGALAEDDVRDALALRKGDQSLRRPVGFHPNDRRPEAFGQLDVLAQ